MAEASPAAAADAPSVPLIDISALSGADVSARRAVAAAVGRACREVGFFLVTGHGVPAELVDQTFAQSALFFQQDAAYKQRLARAELGGNRGYVGLNVEALDERSGRRDNKEAFNVVWSDEGRTRLPTVWPPPVTEPAPAAEQGGEQKADVMSAFRPIVGAYFDATLSVARLLHRAFALDLGLPEDFFENKLDRPQACLRLLHYPAPDEAGAATSTSANDSASSAAPLLSAGEHCDYGNLTLLVTDGVPGLQLRPRNRSGGLDGRGEWIAAPHVPGALVCNLGDCLQRWTSDVYRSTPHRVLAPTRERFSMAMFCEANPDAMVDGAQIPSCLLPGGQAKYPPVTADEYLQSRFRATYGAADEKK